ncbi:thiopeptide-type bacteriocin biosynthesis protein [Chryseobacterium sp. BIGb0232]|uniref:thiopeptide-type bacteriocin biosynthesis protein n=1 Tax=Chryseobacterium sp. BIGb0232 TaxID=2940598 RepID=UPI000FAEF244|nr:thiopeptide-type bacteriocin biosynthesis protein [Chryseobacterium sp. BIGb0232]MCS4305372.1 thiopeptide-type bacteriocin biosynthesis protein [Chryseobacterium sp. BIGb0232]ROS07583.1 thiopeptide-type bacteriocin biosynthesis protein [Chryseobacterium nakagawai]
MKKKFIPGSEWLYVKIYTGVKTADIILEEALLPLLQQLKEEGLIKKWFFIRYNDPKIHLRLRFELSYLKHFGKVLSLLNDYLEEYRNSGEISEFIIDIYQREIERYGEATMEEAEFLFWKSSESIVYEYLHFDDEEKIMVSLYYIDKILECLGLPIQEKLSWITERNLAFKQEFNADKKLNHQLDKKYRVFIINYLEFVESEEYSPFRNVILDNINESGETLKHIKCHSDALQSFFFSVFHMHINRIFVSNQRLFEMIIYDYLFRYYKTLVFKNNGTI